MDSLIGECSIGTVGLPVIVSSSTSSNVRRSMMDSEYLDKSLTMRRKLVTEGQREWIKRAFL